MIDHSYDRVIRVDGEETAGLVLVELTSFGQEEVFMGTSVFTEKGRYTKSYNDSAENKLDHFLSIVGTVGRWESVNVENLIAMGFTERE